MRFDMIANKKFQIILRWNSIFLLWINTKLSSSTKYIGFGELVKHLVKISRKEDKCIFKKIHMTSHLTFCAYCFGFFSDFICNWFLCESIAIIKGKKVNFSQNRYEPPFFFSFSIEYANISTSFQRDVFHLFVEFYH